MNNARRSARQQETPDWVWPFDLTRYDRDSRLARAEAIALALVAQARAGGGSRTWPHSTRPTLQRLLLPLTDALDIIGSDLAEKSNFRSCTTTVILLEMHRSCSSFWAWPEKTWAAIRPAYDKYPHELTSCIRRGVTSVGYLVGSVNDINLFEKAVLQRIAAHVFGDALVDRALTRVGDTINGWGYSRRVHANSYYRQTVCAALLMNRSPRLEDLTEQVLRDLHERVQHREGRRSAVVLSRVLAEAGVIKNPLPDQNTMSRGVRQETLRGIDPTWLSWCRRWADTSTVAPLTRKSIYGVLIKLGRWLATEHPHVTSPAEWTRELAAEFIAAVDRLKTGDWAGASRLTCQRGMPISPKTKYLYISSTRGFFRDCQEWGWIRRRFDPWRSLATPRAVRALMAPDPRVIADDVWAKLLWAGLNLSEEDIPTFMLAKGAPRFRATYPLAMVRAMVHVWLFCGLRKNEFCRLRVGCTRWQRDDLVVPGTERILPKDAVCWLDVPVNKTSGAFTKPVDRIVGESVAAWETLRPEQPPRLDAKTGESVHYLFSFRAGRVGEEFINKSLIPMLCRKAGLPMSDARGHLTSHRARATMASMLHNAREGMSLFDIQAWLGHRSLESTRSYVKTSPTKLAAAFADAGYMERNIRSIKVLIDREAIRSGEVLGGEPWKFYDLGHGYCTYDFFDQCPHRMACAKCSYYLPKDSGRAQMIEAKGNLQRMMQEIPLREEERAAVEDGLEALEKLTRGLTSTPAPDGRTPRELVQITKLRGGR